MSGAEELYSLSVSTAWGRFGLVATRKGLRTVSWPGVKPGGGQKTLEAGEGPAEVAETLGTTAEELTEYFSGKTVRFTARLDLREQSDFARRVLRACTRIRRGQVVTYGQLAEQVGSASSARAVGRVMAGNPLPVVVPCHRVLRGDGGLGGYSGSGGIATKRRLLALENASAAKTKG